MKKYSMVWQFFDRIENNGRCVEVSCKLCEVTYKFYGNTTNLRVHLSRKHPIQWELANNNKPNFSFEDGEETSHSTKPTYKVTAVGEEIEIENEEEEASINLVREFGNADSSEEWLEDQFETVETYKPKQKKMKVKKHIKREYDSSNRLTDLYLKSPNKYDNDRTIVIEEPQTVKDEYSTFGEYIANKLRNLKSPRTRGNIQQIMTTVLWQAEYGTYDSADSVKNLFFAPALNVSNVENQNLIYHVEPLQQEDTQTVQQKDVE